MNQQLPPAQGETSAQPTPPAPAAPPPAPAPVATSAQPAPAIRVALVVDDEPANRDFLVRLLEQANLKVQGAGTGAEALKITEGVEGMALLVIDHRLPDMSGVELLVKLRERFPQACFIMATMHDERELMTKAFENGCNVFLVKPHGFMELFNRLRTTGTDSDELRQKMIIDQYGFRPYRG